MPTRDYGIADLLLRRGQVEGGRLRDLAAAQGQASQQNARIYALDREASAGRASDLIRTLALVGTKAVGDYQENKQNQAANALKQQQLNQQAERDRIAEARAGVQADQAAAQESRAQTTFAQGQKKATDTDQKQTMLSEFLKRSFDPQSKTVNREVLNGFLMNSGMGEAAPGIFKAMDESDAANLNAKKARTQADEAELGYAKTLVTQADASGWNPTVVDALLTQAELHGHGDQVKQMRAMSPDQLKAFGTRLLQGVPTQAQEDAHKRSVAELPSVTANAEGLTPNQAVQSALERERNAIAARAAAATAAKGSGGRKMLSSDANRLTDIKDSLGMLEKLGQESVGGTGTAEWLGTKLPAWVTETTGIGLGPKERQATIALVKQVIGKTLEGGVLRKEDEVKYKDILPTIIDPEDVVKKKLSGLHQVMTKKGQNLLESLGDAGFDVSQSANTFSQKQSQFDTPAQANVKVDASVPANVASALKEAKPAHYTLSDGSVWTKMPDGSIIKGGR